MCTSVSCYTRYLKNKKNVYCVRWNVCGREKETGRKKAKHPQFLR